MHNKQGRVQRTAPRTARSEASTDGVLDQDGSPTALPVDIGDSPHDDEGALSVRDARPPCVSSFSERERGMWSELRARKSRASSSFSEDKDLSLVTRANAAQGAPAVRNAHA